MRRLQSRCNPPIHLKWLPASYYFLNGSFYIVYRLHSIQDAFNCIENHFWIEHEILNRANGQKCD